MNVNIGNLSFDLLNDIGDFIGFDIVIGNPPYIQLQKSLSQSDDIKYADLYMIQGFKKLKGNRRYLKSILYFYEKGINTLKHKGTLSFITSNKCMRAKYGKSLRKLFSENNPLLQIIQDLVFLKRQQ